MWSIMERGAAPSDTFLDWPGWAIPSLMLFNLVCVVGLLRLKKWGFYGSCVSCGLVLVVNLFTGAPMVFVVFGLSYGLIGIIFLYCVLQIGGDKSGWTQLD
jgi:uncharacterized membrane protein (DUF2068 family)